jgi:hypothetical protein
VVAAAVVVVSAGAVVVSVLAGAVVVSVLAGAAVVVVSVDEPHAAANRPTATINSTSAPQSRTRLDRDVGIAGCTSHF